MTIDARNRCAALSRENDDRLLKRVSIDSFNLCNGRGEEGGGGLRFINIHDRRLSGVRPVRRVSLNHQSIPRRKIGGVFFWISLNKFRDLSRFAATQIRAIAAATVCGAQNFAQQENRNYSLTYVDFVEPRAFRSRKIFQEICLKRNLYLIFLIY